MYYFQRKCAYGQPVNDISTHISVIDVGRQVGEFLRPLGGIALVFSIRKWYRIVQYLYLCRSDKSITCIAVSIIYNVFLSLLPSRFHPFAFIARASRCKSRMVYILLFPRYQQWRQRCFTTLISITVQSTHIFYTVPLQK